MLASEELGHCEWPGPSLSKQSKEVHLATRGSSHVFHATQGKAGEGAVA